MYSNFPLLLSKERRATEAQNQREREIARKQRNEEVRQLVAYIKRRDKRIKKESERLAAVASEAAARTHEQAKRARAR
ncbi:unnamed protein product [Protopolystoma xenopodis]|uniref:Uncharacterized protein n=1 Tax=Protopolystoma xenopodis TaxID=117903 RepID=A0A448X7T3_9PLAT|nr:unnamed protein product [Protopolystoma xenopodis]